MWICMQGGFVSIVEKPWDTKRGTLTVRARAEAHLDEFKRLAGANAVKNIYASDADYPFRVQLPRAAVSRALSALVDEVDYDNFKSRVGRVSKDTGDYVHFLHRTWSAALDLELPEARGAFSSSRSAHDRLEQEYNWVTTWEEENPPF